jgi:hypothetical protein
VVDLAELYDADEELRALLAVLAPRYAALLRAVHGLVMDALPGVALERLPLPESAIRQATQRAFEQAVRIDATTREALQAQLRVGLERGYSAWEIGHGVPDEGFGGLLHLFRETWASRPETVARTELATALNHASLDRYDASGVVSRVRLVENEDTDAPCAARNGRIVPLESRPGLLHPNCRLGVVPIVNEGAADGAAE